MMISKMKAEEMMVAAQAVLNNHSLRGHAARHQLERGTTPQGKPNETKPAQSATPPTGKPLQNTQDSKDVKKAPKEQLPVKTLDRKLRISEKMIGGWYLVISGW